MNNKICNILSIQYPIIQGGMIWCSGWELASAVSNAGGLGLIGSGSMYPEILKEHIQKCKKATNKPFGVNVPLIYPDIDKLMDIIINEGVKIVFTSAGNPKTWTKTLQENGITVAHVVSNVKFAMKSEEAGVDMVVAEGFEAGGHNGREETTTFCLIPMVSKAISIPLIAAGGVSSGRAMLAALALGADAVQIGSRFVASEESSAHLNFKNAVVSANEGETELSLKQLTPVRLLKNKFYQEVKSAELRGASIDELKELLGKRRSKKGMFEGDLDEGELEIGQVSGGITSILPVSIIMENLVNEFNSELKIIQKLNFL